MCLIVTIHNINVINYYSIFIVGPTRGITCSLMNTVAGVDGEANFGGFLTRKVPKSTNEVEEVCIAYVYCTCTCTCDYVKVLHILNRDHNSYAGMYLGFLLRGGGGG